MKSLIFSLFFAGVLAQDYPGRPLPPVADDRKFVEYDDYLSETAPRQPPPRVRGNSLRGGGGADCRSKSIRVPHEKHCDLYYVTTGCDDGQSLLRACPNGLVFSQNGRSNFGLVDFCDYPHNVNCAGKTMHNPPISTEHCDWLYGIFGHETSCTRYWTCWNGTATEQFCVGGLLYNEDTHACDWPQNVGGCQKHPLCKDDANGNVPLGKSCNRYWACQGGYPRLQRCPAMLVFDKKRKRCVSPPTDDCDVPSTTPSPPEDEDNDYNDSGSGPRNQRPIQVGNRRRGQQGAGRPQQVGGPQDLPLPFNLPPPDNLN